MVPNNFLMDFPHISRPNIGWAVIAVFAVAIGLYAVMPYFTLDQSGSRIPINQLFDSHRLWLSLHAVPSATALIIGPFQFLSVVRRRWPVVHRNIGKLYLICVFMGSAAASAATLMSTSGFAAQMAFGILTVGWLYSAYSAYRSARQRRFADHRIWMIRNYALTFAGVLLRVFLLGGIALRQVVPTIPFDQIYTFSAWGSLFISAIIAEWFIVTQANRNATQTH